MTATPLDVTRTRAGDHADERSKVDTRRDDDRRGHSLPDELLRTVAELYEVHRHAAFPRRLPWHGQLLARSRRTWS
jgi:hypothetical protein